MQKTHWQWHSISIPAPVHCELIIIILLTFTFTIRDGPSGFRSMRKRPVPSCFQTRNRSLNSCLGHVHIYYKRWIEWLSQHAKATRSILFPDKKRVAKFMPRNDGPYTVVKAFPEKSEYTLRLPNNPQTFPGFHSSLLKPFIPNDATLFPDREFTRPGAVVTEDGTEENMIDKIVDARRRGRGK